MTITLALQGNIILIGLGIAILMEFGHCFRSPRIDSADRTEQLFSDLNIGSVRSFKD